VTRKLKFGLELEFASPMNVTRLVDKIKEYGINIIAKPYGHESESSIDYDFKIVEDASVNGGIFGLELVSKPFTDLQAFTSDLRIIIKVLKKYDCKVNESTGLHVHHCVATHGLSQDDIYNMVRWYSQNDKLIANLIAPHRLHNRFCKPYQRSLGTFDNDRDIKVLNEIFNNLQRNLYHARHEHRYYNVNMLSQIKYNTIEFRQKESTFDIDDIIRWIEFTNACMVYAKKFKVYNEFRRHEFDMEEVKSMFKKLQLDFLDYRDYFITI
jgi:hypothetical protein